MTPSRRPIALLAMGLSSLMPAYNVQADPIDDLPRISRDQSGDRYEDSRNDSAENDREDRDSPSARDQRDQNQWRSFTREDRGNPQTSRSQRRQPAAENRSSERPRLGRGELGLTLVDEGEYGVRVSGVVPGSPAERAGVREGDYLVMIDGQDATSLNEALEIINEFKEENLRNDRPFRVIVDRDGRERELALRTDQNRNQRGSARGESIERNSERIAERAERLGERVARIVDQVRDVTDNLQDADAGEQAYDDNRTFDNRSTAGSGRNDQYADDQPASSVRDEYDRFSEDPAGTDERSRPIRNRRGRNVANNERVEGFNDPQQENQQRNDRQPNRLRANRLSRNAGDQNIDRQAGTQRGNGQAPQADPRVRVSLGVNLDEQDNGRLTVVRVRPNSPADQAGVQEGDEILRIDDQRVYSYNDVMRNLRQYQAGDRVELKLRRDGGTQLVDVELADRRLAMDVPPEPRDREQRQARRERREARRQVVGEVLGEVTRDILSSASELLENVQNDSADESQSTDDIPSPVLDESEMTEADSDGTSSTESDRAELIEQARGDADIREHQRGEDESDAAASDDSDVKEAESPDSSDESAQQDEQSGTSSEETE